MSRRLLSVSLLALLLPSCLLLVRPDDPGTPDSSALSFDGVDDGIVVAHPDGPLNSLSDGLTIEAWIYVLSYPNSHPRIVDRSDALFLPPLGDTFIFGVYAPDSLVHLNVNGYSINAGRIPRMTWTHVAGTFDGTALHTYVNGELQGTRAVTTLIDVADSRLYIGKAERSDRQFHGTIDEIRVWGIARTDREIRDTMNRKLTGAEAGLVAYWPLDEGEGMLVEDQAGKNQGRLGGAVPEEAPTWRAADFPH